MKIKNFFILLSLFQFLTLSACTSEEPPQPPPVLHVQPAKEKVLMGIYPVMLNDFDLSHKFLCLVALQK